VSHFSALDATAGDGRLRTRMEARRGIILAALISAMFACRPRTEGTLFRPIASTPECGSAVQIDGDGPAQGDASGATPGSAVMAPGSEAPPLEEVLEGLRWDRSVSCIPVSYDPDLSSILPDIQTAIATWNSVPCGQLCLESPVADAFTCALPITCCPTQRRSATRPRS
jgi:hypothetical protein